MSNELLQQPLGGDGVEVEIDECYLTRRTIVAPLYSGRMMLLYGLGMLPC